MSGDTQTTTSDRPGLNNACTNKGKNANELRTSRMTMKSEKLQKCRR